MTVPRLLLALAIAALATGVALADDAALRAARSHFERGEKLYALTRFREALDEYQKAFDAKPLPDFLFNIGQCYRNLGDYDAAIFSYRKYLQLAQDPPNRAQVEQLIRELEANRSRSDAQRLGLGRSAGPAAVPEQPADRWAARPAERSVDRPGEQAPGRPVYTRWWFWTGVAVLGVAGGAAVYGATRDGPPGTSLGNIVFGR